MGSLFNLYISQSYQGLLHLASNSTASANLELIEDGLGNGLGLFLNTNGDLRTTTSVSSSRIEANNLVIKNKIELTGSIDIDGPVTASSAFIEGDLNVSGTIYTKVLHTQIITSSIIYSSGSNILGDSTADVQTLIGTINVSGSSNFTGSMFVTNDISSSTLNGIGNVTLYSQSVDSRLDIVEATASLYVPFSQSVDQRLDGVEATASYLDNAFSTSVDARLDALEAFTGSEGLLTTASFQAYTASIRTELDTIEISTASLNSFTQSAAVSLTALNANSASVNNSVSLINSFTASANSRLNSLESVTSSYANSASFASTISSLSSSVVSLSSSVAITDNAQTVRINDLASFTGSYATTGSNFFIGQQLFSGSVEGSVVNLGITSQTASMDLLSANFFTLTLVSGSNTHISVFNGTDGQTISLRITQPSVGFGTVTFSPNVRFPQAFPYIATPSGSAVDIISFQTYDPSFVYGVAVNTMR